MPANRPETMLVVDDAPVALRVIKRNLLSHGYQVLTATSVADAVAILEATPVDLVITDLKMPKVGGLDLVRHVHANFEDTAVIMITGYASIETAVRALRGRELSSQPFTDEVADGGATRGPAARGGRPMRNHPRPVRQGRSASRSHAGSSPASTRRPPPARC